VALTLTDDAALAELNATHMGKVGPTDVLSFPLDESAPGNGHPRMLGDVVISPAVAARQKADLRAELRLLLVHGILHLLGYDHEREEDRRVMWDRQAAYSGSRP
jgi:probable rRNA maturation factor